MNLTLSIDDQLVERARDLAARRGTSLNQMVRDYLAELTADRPVEQVLGELDRLWSQSAGDSKGTKWAREDLHERIP